MVSQLSQGLILRPAIVQDAAWAVPLLFATGPALFSYVFATSPDAAEQVLQQAFVLPHHAFSYEHTQVVEVNGVAAGLIIGYPGTVKKKADEKMHFAMAQIIPLRKLPPILLNMADFSRIKQDVALDDYYILGISVATAFRQQGIGSQLLTWAEQQAREWQCLHVCGDIPYINTAAKRLFERRGYQVVCSKTTDRFQQITQAGGIHRVRKLLPPGIC